MNHPMPENCHLGYVRTCFFRMFSLQQMFFCEGSEVLWRQQDCHRVKIWLRSVVEMTGFKMFVFFLS